VQGPDPGTPIGWEERSSFEDLCATQMANLSGFCDFDGGGGGGVGLAGLDFDLSPVKRDAGGGSGDDDEVEMRCRVDSFTGFSAPVTACTDMSVSLDCDCAISGQCRLHSRS
jgi:hypothetical protein